MDFILRPPVNGPDSFSALLAPKPLNYDFHRNLLEVFGFGILTFVGIIFGSGSSNSFCGPFLVGDIPLRGPDLELVLRF